jgi:hypothetical protein
VSGKALMRDSSAVIIQLLDILGLRKLYSNNWDVNDSSGCFLDLCWLYVRLFAPSHRDGLRKTYEINGLSIETRS